MRDRGGAGVSDEQDGQSQTVAGKTEPSGDGAVEYPVAVLWMPDPTTDSGWCDHAVYRKKKPDRKPLGFRQ